MAVNFPSIDPAALHPVAGVTLGWAEANIRKPNRKDLLVIQLEEGATVARRVHAESLLRGAGDGVPRASRRRARGRQGHSRARREHGQRECGHRRAGHGAYARNLRRNSRGSLDLDARQILPFSTGVILEPLPVDRLKAGLPAALANQKAAHWYDAAQTIMTTDTLPKAVIAPGADRRPHGHAVGHQQGRRHDQAEHGDHARFPRIRCRRRATGARSAGRSTSPIARSTASRSTAIRRRTIRSS